ncbi:LOW QUALITY PROTEIN: uncharacterized protein LOC110988343 [Acanthaster planci]|uniref:LOW QUALITY PROTEIN: uncharacterized protein LOC110988343 n=1 Tax=Acanthaster planci TaxID=133434 RepID=A0A8B7ZQT7_ACAPL|nr:LOW QUALITY PROTEIN: uncharacterized protein LOC110988343 [Acanthaster planci]
MASYIKYIFFAALTLSLAISLVIELGPFSVAVLPRFLNDEVIIGSGPVALGAAQRLYDLRQGNSNTVITILEELDRPAGLDLPERDEQGFLWDTRVYEDLSHYTYFNQILNRAITEWNYRRRAPFAFMKGSDGLRRFVPYPVQNNIHIMDKGDQQKCLSGLEEITRNQASHIPENLDQWLVQKFGAGLRDVFMRKYYRKFWTMDTTELNSVWIGEQAAVPDIEEIKTKIKEVDNGTIVKTVAPEPSTLFRFPKYNGTGGIWEATARLLPEEWFKFHQKVTGVNADEKVITVEVGQHTKSLYTLRYDTLISTVPLDTFIGLLKTSDSSLVQIQELVSQLLYTHTHIVGIGLSGQPPKTLAEKSWVYFPDSDSPFYRVMMYSNFSEDLVPKAGLYWSLICEVTEPMNSRNTVQWSKTNLVEATDRLLSLLWIYHSEMVVSKHYRRLNHGYPVPSLKRDVVLDTIQPWLLSKDIYSRGRFGGWRYEVANQDHLFMQGVDIVDKIEQGVSGLTYLHPSLANSKKNTDRVIPLDYEFVIAHYSEDLEWLKPYAEHTIVYHKGNDPGPPFRLHDWERLENVGRESHTYLHHIVTNYHQLANVTVFAQADHLKGRCFKDIHQFVSSAKKGVPCLGLLKLHTDWGRIPFTKEYLESFKNRPIDRANVTFGEFYYHLYGVLPPAKGIENCRNGCFGATKEMIWKHPIEFYQKAMSFVSKSSNGEEGHYLERIWYHFFA